MQDDSQSKPTIEGEVVDESTTQAVPNDGAGQIVANMESLIKNHQLKIDQSAEELKKQNDMLNDVLANEPELQKLTEEAKEANKRKNAVKQQILNRPEVADLARKVKQLRADIKNLKEALSDYLGEYARISGTNVVEGYDGELREIVYVAKLVRRSTKDEK